jgi:hypothetical protein
VAFHQSVWQLLLGVNLLCDTITSFTSIIIRQATGRAEQQFHVGCFMLLRAGPHYSWLSTSINNGVSTA